MDNHYDVLTIGHTSLDYNIDYLDNTVVEIGGAVIYSSAAAYALGHKVAAITKLAREDVSRLNALTLPKEDIYCNFSEHSTSIRNKYFTADKERRSCVCLSQAESFSLADIPEGVKGDVYHLAGLIYGDFDGELIKALSKLGKVAVDVQALLRHADGENGEMYFRDWADKKELLPYIDYFKTDTAEAEILTGTTDRAVAARMMHEWGAKEVVITNNKEVLAYDGTTMATCPIKARNLSGRSGRGDTTFSAYISERKEHSLKEALLWATATVSLKMEHVGALKASRADIQAYIEEFYK